MTRATAPRRRRHTFNDAIKRGLDVTGAAVGLFLTAPVMLVVAVLVRFKLGSPVFFVQERPGQDGKIFRMFKFRTMTDTRDASGNLLPDADRLTRFGAFLRKTSLDELPEL
ncbi:MAG: sugar transferase, partial [Anaerolineae bacterium]|nr:sugar transferase [Anaerolineae bacterium]